MRKTHPLLVGIENVTPYRTVSGDSLYNIKPPAMQIDDFLPVGGIMGMTSYPGVGKTWLAMEVTRAITSGQPFLGRYRSLRGGVLFVGSDSSLYDYARQWTRLTRATPDAVSTYEPVRFLVQSTFMFEDRDEVRKLIRSHQMFEWGEPHEGPEGPQRERGFHAIVFDTVSRLTRADQNNNTEMEEVFRNIRWISEATDAAIVLLHHNSKKSEFNDGADWRGAMSQIGALDSWVQLVPHRRDKHLIGIQFKKFRGITPPDFSFRMHVTDPETALLIVTDEPVTLGQRMTFDPVAEAVKTYVEQNPGKRACEIRDALWPKFQTGVAAPGDKAETISFATERLLLNAINNRLNAMLPAGIVIRSQTEEGKSVYHAKAKAAEVPAEAEVPAQAERRAEPAPKRAKTAKNKGKRGKK